MPSKHETPLYIPQQQTQTLYFVKEGAPDEQVELWVDIRADLTFDEREGLFWDDTVRDAAGEPVLDERGKPTRDPKSFEDVCDLIAPFVLDWSVGQIVDGKPVKVEPPVVAGGQQLKLINERYVLKILEELRFRSAGVLKTSFLPKSQRLASPTLDGNVAAITTNGKA